MRLPEPVVKVCGVRDQTVLEAALEAGATAIGFNFVPWSRRRIDPETARAYRAWARAQGRFDGVTWIGVFADASRVEVKQVRDLVGFDWVQLHGEVSDTALLAWRTLSPTLRALGVSSAADVEMALRCDDDQILVDARREDGSTGGTGRAIDPELLEPLRARGGVIVAGGLRADTVASIVERFAPAGVDTASGAEDPSGAPSPAEAEAFVRSARAAFARIEDSK